MAKVRDRNTHRQTRCPLIPLRRQKYIHTSMTGKWFMQFQLTSMLCMSKFVVWNLSMKEHSLALTINIETWFRDKESLPCHLQNKHGFTLPHDHETKQSFTGSYTEINISLKKYEIHKVTPVCTAKHGLQNHKGSTKLNISLQFRPNFDHINFTGIPLLFLKCKQYHLTWTFNIGYIMVPISLTTAVHAVMNHTSNTIKCISQASFCGFYINCSNRTIAFLLYQHASSTKLRQQVLGDPGRISNLMTMEFYACPRNCTVD